MKILVDPSLNSLATSVLKIETPMATVNLKCNFKEHQFQLLTL